MIETKVNSLLFLGFGMNHGRHRNWDGTLPQRLFESFPQGTLHDGTLGSYDHGYGSREVCHG